MSVLVDAVPCSNACHFCKVCEPFSKEILYSTEELQEIVKTWGPIVPFADPTLHPEFPAIMKRRITPEGLTYMCSNGARLVQKEDHFLLLTQMRDWGFEGLSFTLHGLADSHDWYVNRAGAFHDILQATRQGVEAGFFIHWNLFLDRRNLGEASALSAMASDEYGGTLYLDLPRHRVHPHMWRYEHFRPSLHDMQTQLPDDLIAKRWDQPLHTMTETAWLQVLEREPDDDLFSHPFEPKSWPPAPPFDELCFSITRDRKVYLDPFCSPPVYLGDLSESRDTLIEKLQTLPAPQALLDPLPKHYLRQEDADLIHPCGYSVRYKAIAASLGTGKSSGCDGALDFCGHF